MEENLYPNFRQEVIDDIAASEGSPHWITSFQFHNKGKRRDDLVAFGLGRRGKQSGISFYENPQNLDLDEGIEDESVLTKWNKLSLQTLDLPSTCISADITGNGLNDLVVTCEYGDSLDYMDPYGGQVCWLENFGTNEGDWSYHEIGRFPGVNCIKVGHFSTTYSRQLLGVVKCSRKDDFSPLVIFTRPPDIYESQHWLVAIALENCFSAVQDCIVIQSTIGALDTVLVSSREGLSVAWYQGRSWQCKPLDCAWPDDYLPGRLCAVRAGRDPVSCIVCSEANGGGRLAIITKDFGDGKHREFRGASWTCSIIADFSEDQDASILDVLCEDFDHDGVDEIIVSIYSKGPSAGVYYFVRDWRYFTKYKLYDEPVTKLTCGRFALKDRLDLAMLTRSDPCNVVVLYHSFVSSQIAPTMVGSQLIMSVPRIAMSASEIDIIDVAGYIISLIVLPPNASYDIAPDGSVAIKVLHGLLGWIDSQSEVIERTCVACEPGCVTPMLVDSPEGLVRSGDDGAVFVRLTPSNASDAVHMKAINVLPPYFPCNARDYEFSWQNAGQRRVNETPDDDSPDKLFHLSGFRVRFDACAPTENVDIAYVHFYAAAPGSSTGFVKDDGRLVLISCDPCLQRRIGPRKASICSIRTSLSNPSGESGLVYCEDPLDWGTTPPTSYSISRARKLILPVLYEHGPFWRPSKMEGEKDDIVPRNIEYPWHSWVAGRVGQRQRENVKWDVWAAFDLTPSDWPRSPKNDECSCTIC